MSEKVSPAIFTYANVRGRGYDFGRESESARGCFYGDSRQF
jgi:hypothetical protein